MQRLALLFLLLAAAWNPCKAETYRIDPSRSKIAFSLRHLLGTVRGEFHKFSGTIEANQAVPERFAVNVAIAVSSIDTGIRKRDNHLMAADFFSAKAFPEITFRSRNVKRTGPGSGDISGDLTMHGVTRPLLLHAKLATPLTAGAAPTRTRWVVTSEPIRRKEFGLSFGATTEKLFGIGNEVAAVIEIEAVLAE